MEKKARYETFKLHINLVAAIGLSQVWFVIGSFLVDVDLVSDNLLLSGTSVIFFQGVTSKWLLKLFTSLAHYSCLSMNDVQTLGFGI